MFDRVNTNSSIAVYVQIKNLVRFAVANGRLKAGDKLPGIHELAGRLDLNVVTVVKAYRELEFLGIVYARQGQGVFICEGAVAKCREAVRREVLGRMYETAGEAKAAGMSAKEVRECVERLYGAVGEPYGVDEALVRALVTGR